MNAGLRVLIESQKQIRPPAGYHQLPTIMELLQLSGFEQSSA